MINTTANKPLETASFWLTRLGLTLVATALLVAALGTFTEAFAQEDTPVKNFNILVLGEKKLDLQQISKTLGGVLPPGEETNLKISLTYKNFDQIDQLDPQVFNAVLIATAGKISDTIQIKIKDFESKLKEGTKVITVRMSSKMQDYALKALRVMVGAGILTAVLDVNHSLWGVGLGVWLAYYGSGWVFGVHSIGILKNIAVKISEIKNSQLVQKISIAGVSLLNSLKQGTLGLLNLKSRIRAAQASVQCSAALL